MAGLTADQVTAGSAMSPPPGGLATTDQIFIWRPGVSPPVFIDTLADLIAFLGPNLFSAVVPASENIAKGALVNIWNNAGVPNVRNANGNVRGKPAHGFAAATVLGGSALLVSFAGLVAPTAGLTAGPVFLAAVAGGATSAPLSGVGVQVSQQVGICADPSGASFMFQPQTAFNL